MSSRERQREWAKANPERIQKNRDRWIQANPDHHRVIRIMQKRRARKRAGRRTWEQLLEAKAMRITKVYARRVFARMRVPALDMAMQAIPADFVRAGEQRIATVWRWRYQTDAAFREKEIARTWARKAAAGTLRTDGRSTRRVNDDGTLGPRQIRSLFASATCCPYCSAVMSPRVKTLDHLVPISRGGEHSITNVVVCCRTCNMCKRTRTALEFVVSLVNVCRFFPYGRDAGADDRVMCVYDTTSEHTSSSLNGNDLRE